MTIIFYIVWFLAVLRVVCSPFTRWIKKILFVGSIAIGLWLLIGVSVYQTKHLEYERKRVELQGEIDIMYDRKTKLEGLLSTHPTSRDVLIALGRLAYRLHDQNTLHFALHQLERIDPNNPKTLELSRNSQ